MFERLIRPQFPHFCSHTAVCHQYFDLYKSSVFQCGSLIIKTVAVFAYSTAFDLTVWEHLFPVSSWRNVTESCMWKLFYASNMRGRKIGILASRGDHHRIWALQGQGQTAQELAGQLTVLHPLAKQPSGKLIFAPLSQLQTRTRPSVMEVSP